MTELKEEKMKKSLVNRLRRIEGQIRGVQSMIDEERDCRQILQQLSAVRAAIKSTTRVILQEYAAECLLDLENTEKAQREKLLEDLVAVLDKSI